MNELLKYALFVNNIKMEEMSYGMKAVGFNYNPSNDPKVSEIKKLYAEIIDKMDSLRAKSENPEQKRLCSVAITEAQGAQMRAVKAQTWDK